LGGGIEAWESIGGKGIGVYGVMAVGM